jgi:hypothetical protein
MTTLIVIGVLVVAGGLGILYYKIKEAEKEVAEQEKHDREWKEFCKQDRIRTDKLVEEIEKKNVIYHKERQIVYDKEQERIAKMSPEERYWYNKELKDEAMRNDILNREYEQQEEREQIVKQNEEHLEEMKRHHKEMEREAAKSPISKLSDGEVILGSLVGLSILGSLNKK